MDAKLRAQFTVYGFIKEAQELLPKDATYYIIPDLVIHTCLLFYFVNDRFDPDCHGKSMELDEDKQCMKQIKATSASAFLSNIVEYGYHSWRFGIVKCGRGRRKDGWSAMIGLWKVDEEKDKAVSNLPINTYFSAYKYANRYYSFVFPMGALISGSQASPSSDQASTYGIQCGGGDIIEMYCDMDELTMGFIINNKDYGKAFDIDKCKYRAAINMHDKDDSITLL